MSGEPTAHGLSYAQERLWFLHRLTPGEAAYNFPVVLRLRGALDVAALTRALRRVVDRHDVLRSRFPVDDGQPSVRTAPRGGLDVPLVDLTDRPPQARHSAAEALVAAEAGRPFELAVGPLVRAVLVRLDDTEHVLAVTTHHIAFDGWSAALFQRELATLYAACRDGRTDPLPPIPIQYGDYADWQRRQADTTHAKQQLAWWLEHLDGAPTALELPTDRPRRAPQRYAGAVASTPLPASLWRRVGQLSKAQRGTPFMTLYAVCSILLAEFTGQDDLIIGVPMSQRTRIELEPLIGLFVNTLPLRVRVDRGATFTALLRQVQESAVAAFANREVPFERLIDELRPPRTTSRPPLAQVVFAPDFERPAPPSFAGLSAASIALPTTTTKFELVVAVTPATEDSADGYAATVAYRTDLFDASTAARLATQFRDLLDEATAKPHTLVGRLLTRVGTTRDLPDRAPATPSYARPAAHGAGPILADPDDRAAVRHHVLSIWRDVLDRREVEPRDNFFDLGGNSLLLVKVHARLTARLGRQIPLLALYEHTTVESLVRYLCGDEPGGTGSADGGESEGAGRRRLRHHGGRLVDVDQRPEPMRAADPAAVVACVHEFVERQARVAGDRIAVDGPATVLTYAQLNRRANQLARYLLRVGIRPGDPVAVLLDRSPEYVVAVLAILKTGAVYVPLDSGYPAARLAAMLDDAGAGTVVTDTRLASSLDGPARRIVRLDELDKDLAGLLDHDLGLPVSALGPAYVMFTSGSSGRPKGVLVPHRGVVGLVRDADWVALSADEVVLHLSSVSFDASTFEIWGALTNGGRLVVAPPDPPALADIGALIQRYGVTTALLTTGLFHVMVDERLADLAGLRQLVVGGDALSVAHVRRAVAGLPGCQIVNAYGPTEATTVATTYPVPDTWVPGRSVPIGRPIGHAIVRILDEYMQPVPIGIPGQLFVGGDGLALAYLSDAARTAERFVPDPHATAPGARVYATGDRARHLSDGTIEFLGRLDEQVKIRGFRVEPGEVQTVLREHPDVRDALVVADGETADTRRLLAYLVLRAGCDGDRDRDAVVATVRAWLRTNLPTHLVPDIWMVVDALPLTPHGKVDRERLPAPRGDQMSRAESTGDEERVIAAIWAEVLGVERVGPHDDFFDLGGYSILAMKVLLRLRQALDLDLPLSAMFDYPTVAELSELIRGTTVDETVET